MSSLEVVVFKKCYKQGEAVIRCNQVVWGIAKDFKKGTNKLLNKILGLYSKGETSGELPTDDEGVWMSWRVATPITLHELNETSRRLKVC